MKTMLFNPYTGTPRHPDDIKSDPQGLLIVEPDAPMAAAELASELAEIAVFLPRSKERDDAISNLRKIQSDSPTAGMTIEQRILHVGGRNNAAGYVEFGSVQAVRALVMQVLRDIKGA